MEELQKYLNSTIRSYEASLLDLINKKLGHRNLELSLPRKCDKNAVSNLEAILSTKNPNRVAAGKAFERIEVYYSRSVFDAIEKEFIHHRLLLIFSCYPFNATTIGNCHNL